MLSLSCVVLSMFFFEKTYIFIVLYKLRMKLFGGTVPPAKHLFEVLYLRQKSYLEVRSWTFLSGKEKVIYLMKNLGFRL